MGACLMCSRGLIMAFNVFMFLVGVAILGCGVYIRFFADKHIEPLIVETVVAMRSYHPSLYIDPATLHPDLSSIMTIGVVLLVIGVVIILLTIFGCVSAGKKSYGAAVAYAVIFTTLTIAQLVCVVMLVTRQLDGQLKDLGRRSMMEFNGFLGTNPDSLFWNYLHFNFECCGVDSYKDFNGATTPNWDKTPTIAEMPLKLWSPISCCKTMTSFPLCAADPFNADNYRLKGCFGAVEKYMADNGIMQYIQGAMFGTVAVQLLIVILAIIVAVELRREGKADKNKLRHYKSRYGDNYDYSAHRSGKPQQYQQPAGGYYDNYGQAGAYPAEYPPSYGNMYDGGNSRAYYESMGF